MSNSNILLSNSKPCRLHSSAMTERNSHVSTRKPTWAQDANTSLPTFISRPVKVNRPRHGCIHILCLNHSKLCILYLYCTGRVRFRRIRGSSRASPAYWGINQCLDALTFDTWAAATLTSQSHLRASQPWASRDRRLAPLPLLLLTNRVCSSQTWRPSKRCAAQTAYSSEASHGAAEPD